MKSLLLSTFDLDGGASRSAYRLHQGLQRCQSDAQMLVQVKSSQDNTVISPRPNFRRDFAKVRPSFDSLPLKLYPHHEKTAFSCQLMPDFLYSKIQQINPDIINLHWICDGFVQIETIAKLKQPIVWTLHDMWAFTGGCHYSQACLRYATACGSCPQLQSQRDFDLSRWIWQRKAKAWEKLNLTIVTPSQWLATCAQASSLFRNQRIEVIPYGLDLDRYQPLDQRNARNLLNLPPDKQLILSGAINYTNDSRKGFNLLQASLNQLVESDFRDKVALVIYGSEPPNQPVELAIPCYYLGTLKDDLSLALAYSSADVFVAPSLQDNLPNTVMEALACGTPCVAFKIGGMPDLIEHQQTGFLAQPFEVASLTQGITWVLETQARQQTLAAAARAKAKQTYSLEQQAQRYIALFQELLSDRAVTPIHGD